MIRFNHYGETTLINTKVITYIYTEDNYSYVTNPYKVIIKFVGGGDLVASFPTEEERKQFLNELITDMDNG